RIGKVGNASRIAAGPAKTRDEPELYRIRAPAEHNWNGRRRRFRCLRRNQSARGNNHSDLAVHELGGQARQPVEASFGPAVFDADLLPVNEAALLQAPAKRLHEMRALVGCADAEITDERYRGPLRECSKR